MHPKRQNLATTTTKYEWISDMKITKQQLKQIIKEELSNILSEAFDPSQKGALGKLEPKVDKAAADVLDDIDREAGDDEGLAKTIAQVLIAKLQGLVDQK